eukprot:1014249-Pleurochrysis_carterae.AAC.1
MPELPECGNAIPTCSSPMKRMAASSYAIPLRAADRMGEAPLSLIMPRTLNASIEFCSAEISLVICFRFRSDLAFGFCSLM